MRYAFAVPAEGYEWTTTLININPGYNDDILEKCEMLKSYSTFIAAIRENAQKSPNSAMDEIIDLTVTQFQDMNDEFGTFLRSHRAEVVDVCITTYDEDKVMAYLREEAIAEGLAEGRAEGRENMLYELVQDGTIRVEIAAEKLGISADKVKESMDQAGYEMPADV